MHSFYFISEDVNGFQFLILPWCFHTNVTIYKIDRDELIQILLQFYDAPSRFQFLQMQRMYTSWAEESQEF
jgi:hypothetical protein